MTSIAEIKICSALQVLTNNKAGGLDCNPAELLKHGGTATER